MAAVPATIPPAASTSLLAKFAARFEVDPKVMLTTLKSTAFKQRGDAPEVSNEQMVALLIVADQHGLNPFTKEIYAFADKGGITPVVGVDGWYRIVNEHPDFDGVEFHEGPAGTGGLPEWIECAMFRKSRSHPTRVREYMAECKRGTDPWTKSPRRMLRHRAFIQAARMTFGFAMHDPNDFEGLPPRDITPRPAGDVVAELNRQIAAQPAQPVTTIDADGVIETGGAEAPPPADDTPRAMTYAEVADAIAKAKNPDELENAGALIQLAPREHQPELGNVFAKRRKELAQ